MGTPAIDIREGIDSNTGESVTFKETSVWHDGTAMNDAKCDGFIYRKKGTEYYRRQFNGSLTVSVFGAKGDGITDDTLSIQKALDLANQLKYNEVFFPSGVYRITSTIHLRDFVKIRGVGGRRQGFLLPAAKQGTIIKVDFVGTGIDHITTPDSRYPTGISDLTIWSDLASILLDVTKMQNAVFSNINFQGKVGAVVTGSIGLKGQDDGSFNIFQNCIFQSLDYGVGINATLGTPFDNNLFIGCFFTACNTGVSMMGGNSGNIFSGCGWGQNTLLDLEDGGVGNQYVGFRIESPAETNILISTASINVTIVGSVINGVYKSGFIKDQSTSGRGHTIKLNYDNNYYGTPASSYGPVQEMGYTDQTSFNFIKDPIGLKSTNAGLTKTIESTYYEGYPIAKYTGGASLGSIFLNAIDFAYIQLIGRKITASIWIKASAADNTIRFSLEFFTETGQVTKFSNVVYPGDGEFHLFTVTALVPSNINATSDSVRLRVLKPVGIDIYISKPSINLGSLSFNAENDPLISQAKNSFTTANRPVLPSHLKGSMIFDETLGRPMFWNGVSFNNSDPNATTTVKGLVNQSAASADTAAPIGVAFSQTEVQAILTELRDLKTKMRAAGLLAT